MQKILVMLLLIAIGPAMAQSPEDPELEVTVKYNLNGGGGRVPSAQEVENGSSITLPDGDNFSMSGYVFGGWNTKADGTGTNFGAGASYTVTTDVTLYAEWDAVEKPKPFSRIGLGLGGSITGYRDEVDSPINRYLNTVTYFFDGNVEKGIFFYSFNINFLMGVPRIAAPYTGYKHTEYIAAKGGIENAFDFRLWGNKTFPGYLGGSMRAVVYLAGVDFTDNGSENPSPPTGGLVLSLDLHASQKWIINEKHTLVFSVGYPLLGYAIRPAYAFFDEYWMEYLYEDRIKLITLGKFVSFHNYWAVFGDLKYHYTFNSLISPYAGLGFEISRINFPRPRIDAIFRLNAGISFTF